jgi:hypothetical protein
MNAVHDVIGLIILGLVLFYLTKDGGKSASTVIKAISDGVSNNVQTLQGQSGITVNF